MRQWDLATVMLAPFILSNRKPLESSCFIDLYTKVDDKLSENKIYLLYKCGNSQLERYKVSKIFYMFAKEPCYLYYDIIHKNNESYYLAVFKSNNIDNLKRNTTFYTINDKFKICCFWGDKIREFKDLIDMYLNSIIKQKTLTTKCD